MADGGLTPPQPMAPKQPGIGRLTSTPHGVDMADGGSKPPQPMAPEAAEGGWKPPRLVQIGDSGIAGRGRWARGGGSEREGRRWARGGRSAGGGSARKGRRARGGGSARRGEVMGTSGDLSLLILGFHHFRVSMAQQGMRRQGWIV